MQLVRGQAAGGGGRDKRARTGNGFDATARRQGSTHDPLPWIANAGSARVGHQRDLLAPLEALNDFFASFRFVEFEVTEQRTFYLERVQKLAGVACVLRRNDVTFSQDPQGTQGDVFEIANGGGNQVERSGAQWRQLLFHSIVREL